MPGTSRPRPDASRPPSNGDADGVVKGLKGAQVFLKKHGYTLTSFGPYRVTFYLTATKRTPEGLIPDRDWYDLTQKRFRLFIAALKQQG